LEVAVARVSDVELAQLKAEVSVQRLVEGVGVELRRQGRINDSVMNRVQRDLDPGSALLGHDRVHRARNVDQP